MLIFPSRGSPRIFFCKIASIFLEKIFENFQNKFFLEIAIRISQEFLLELLQNSYRIFFQEFFYEKLMEFPEEFSWKILQTFSRNYFRNFSRSSESKFPKIPPGFFLILRVVPPVFFLARILRVSFLGILSGFLHKSFQKAMQIFFLELQKKLL